MKGTVALVALLLPSLAVGAPPPGWPGEDMPVPLGVRSQQDLSFKTEVERVYLVFRLMAAGKVAFDSGDYASAIKRWEELLRLPNVPSDVEKAVRPLLAEARKAPDARPGPPAAPDAPVAAPSPAPVAAEPAAEAARARPGVAGVLTGGGAVGPAGAVLWLKRLDGPTPPPRPGRKRVMNQKNKTFVPRVIAVPVGTKIEFRNDDGVFHNVFSLSKPRRFDSGLFARGVSHVETFDKPGAVEILCNIHASMIGYIYVVDSPYYAQPHQDGSFAIRGVPPGQYELNVWHEATAQVLKRTLNVGPRGVAGLAVKVVGDHAPRVIVPDKYGKPRHPQLGY